MKLVKPSFEIKEQEPGYAGMLKHIEWAGRHCYKSLDKITEESAPKFVDMLVKRGHTAMVEHGTVYLKYSITLEGSMNMANKYHFNKYSTVTIGNEPLCGGEPQEYKDKFDGHTYAYITTNYRVLLQNGWLDDLKYQCEPTKYHVKRVTVKFVTCQGLLREFSRHRVFSYAVESTRYCNYSKDKFGSEITYILPNWMDEKQLGTHNSNEITIQANGFQEFSANNQELCEIAFMSTLAQAEINYNTLIRLGWKPQQAREVLPLATKCDLVMTGTVEQWKAFFELRGANDAHPQSRELVIPLREEFIRRGLLQ